MEDDDINEEHLKFIQDLEEVVHDSVTNDEIEVEVVGQIRKTKQNPNEYHLLEH